MDGAEGIHSLVADIDGSDGTGETVRATVGPDTLKWSAMNGQHVNASLNCNAFERFFRLLGDNLVTRPTLTNVNEFRAILIA